MYPRFTKSKKSRHPTLQIVEGKREGTKVRQKIIASLGVVKNEKDKKRMVALADNLINKLEKEGFPIERKIRIKNLLHKKTVYDGFGIVVDRLMNITGLSKTINKIQGRNQFNLENVVKLIITQRISLPSSKLRTYERQEDHGFYGIELQQIYRAMDLLESINNDIQKQAFETILTYSSSVIDCFFFDVTTLYFESDNKDDLKNFGFSKDQKTHMVQIVLALVVNSEGIPLAYEVFQGNLAETKTLIPVLESLKLRFNIANVTVVCDRGMASKANVEALQNAKFHFIIATKLKTLSKKLTINNISDYSYLPNQDNISDSEKILFRTIPHPQYDNTTLIITYSPKRAAKDKEDRERLLEKLSNKLGDHSSNEASVKQLINNSGYKKYTNIKEGSAITLNQKAIDKDISWDGFHGIAVSNDANINATEALSRYKDLWHVEEAFRVAKCTLKTRPIFHWKPHRIRAHISLCFITLFFERFLELLLRKESIFLTPDKIRYALSGVHTTYFEDKSTKNSGRLPSMLSPDAENIFKILNISLNREAATSNESCV